MADAENPHSAGEPDKEALRRLLDDPAALQGLFRADPALVKLILSNKSFLETLFAQPVRLRAFLQTNPVDEHNDLDQLLAGMALGGDGAALARPRRPEEARLATLLRAPQAPAFFRGQPELVEALLRNPAFAEQVKVRQPKFYQELLDKARERFGCDPDMAGLIESEKAGIIDFTPEGLVVETHERRAMRENGMALLEALKKDDMELARLLIERGADPTMQDERQYTPLHWAALHGHTDLAGLLIEKGADPNATDEWLMTPLHFAVGNGHTDLARLLLEKGADPNARDDLKQTPLHRAVEGGYTDIAGMLIEKGGDLTVGDQWQRSLLHWVAKNGCVDLARMLIDKGANPYATDQWQRTLLHWTAEYGHTDLARLLIHQGSDPKAADQEQQTPLHFAAGNGYTDLARLLIEKGADPNATDKWLMTPLHWAAEKYQTDIVRLLIATGADPTRKDHWQRTPQHCAVTKGHTLLVNLLQDVANDQALHAGRLAKRRGSGEPQLGG